MTPPGFHRVQKQWFWFVVSNFSENEYRKTRCFQHRGVKTRGVSTTWFLVFSTLPAIFNTFFYCIPVQLFTEIPVQLFTLIALKPYCAPALNTRKAEGIGLICTHIFTWFQHGACVSTSCIPALTASFSRYPSPLKNVRRYCIPAFFCKHEERIHQQCQVIFLPARTARRNVVFLFRNPFNRHTRG